jgi:hypothetical protein
MSEFKLVPAKLLQNPKTAKFLNDVSHKIFEKMKITPPTVIEPYKFKKTEAKVPTKWDKFKEAEKAKKAKKGSDEQTYDLTPKDRARSVGDTSMIARTPKRTRANATDEETIHDLSLPMELEDVFEYEEPEGFTMDDLINMIPNRYKEDGQKLLSVIAQDYDHTTEFGQERLIELVNVYLFRHTPSIPQFWMYDLMFERMNEIKELNIVPVERKKFLDKKDLRELRDRRTISLRHTNKRALSGNVQLRKEF